MPRRIENVKVLYKRDAWGLARGRKYRMLLQIGRKQFLAQSRLPLSTFRALEVESQEHPVLYMTVNDRAYWRFQDRWYWDNEDLTAQQIHAIIVTRQERRQAKLQWAETVAAMGQSPSPKPESPTNPAGIPDDVRLQVWKRDGGACKRCGSNSELQFDYLIPESLGGASTPENLQVLCLPCTRQKSIRIA